MNRPRLILWLVIGWVLLINALFYWALTRNYGPELLERLGLR